MCSYGKRATWVNLEIEIYNLFGDTLGGIAFGEDHLYDVICMNNTVQKDEVFH